MGDVEKSRDCVFLRGVWCVGEWWLLVDYCVVLCFLGWELFVFCYGLLCGWWFIDFV